MPLPFMGALVRFVYSSTVATAGDTLSVFRGANATTSTSGRRSSLGASAGGVGSAAASRLAEEAALDAGRFPPLLPTTPQLSPPLSLGVQYVLLQAWWRSMQLNTNVTRWAQAGGIECTVALMLRAAASGWEDGPLADAAADTSDIDALLHPAAVADSWLFEAQSVSGVALAQQCVAVLQRAVRASTYVLDTARTQAATAAAGDSGRRGSGMRNRTSSTSAATWMAVPMPRIHARLARPDLLCLIVQVTDGCCGVSCYILVY